MFQTEGNRDWSEIIKIVPRLVRDKDNEVLVKEVCEKIILKVVFELGALKALRPDG